MSAKRLVAALVAFAGAAAFTACLLALADGMRDVMQTDGGFLPAVGLTSSPISAQARTSA